MTMDSQDRSIIAISSSHGIMHAYLVLLPAMNPIPGGELGDVELGAALRTGL